MTQPAPDQPDPDEPASFGDRLVAAREAAETSQKTLAKRIGVKTKTIAAWENDLAEPRANQLQTLAGLLNVSLVWLLNGEGEGGLAQAGEPKSGQRGRLVLRQVRDIRRDIDDTSRRLARLENELRPLLEVGTE